MPSRQPGTQSTARFGARAGVCCPRSLSSRCLPQARSTTSDAVKFCLNCCERLPVITCMFASDESYDCRSHGSGCPGNKQRRARKFNRFTVPAFAKQTALSEKGEIINGRGDTSPHRRRSAVQASSASRACMTEVPLLRHALLRPWSSSHSPSDLNEKMFESLGR